MRIHKPMDLGRVALLSDPSRQSAGRAWQRTINEKIEAAGATGARATHMRMREPYVYVIQALTTGDIKVGIARDVPLRFRELQCANSQDLGMLLVLEGGKLKEQAIYQRFLPHLIRNEWFRPHADVLGWIAAVAERLGLAYWEGLYV